MKHLKPIRYTYTDSNYGYTLEVIFTNNIKRSVLNVYKRWGIEEDAYDCDACVAICEGRDGFADITKYAIIFKYEALTHGTIAHECQHLSAFILDDREIDLAGGNSDYENLAWLNGHLNEIIHVIIEKEKIPIYKAEIEPKIKKG